MRKARPGSTSGNGPGKSETVTQFSTPPVPRPNAPKDRLKRLGQLRREYDRWHANGRVGQPPQPRDFDLRLPDLDPSQVLWGPT